MLPQLLGEDSGPNEAVPTAELVDEVLLLVDVEGVSVDVECEVEAWVVLDVTCAGAVVVALVVGDKKEVWVEVDTEVAVPWMLLTK